MLSHSSYQPQLFLRLGTASVLLTVDRRDSLLRQMPRCNFLPTQYPHQRAVRESLHAQRMISELGTSDARRELDAQKAPSCERPQLEDGQRKDLLTWLRARPALYWAALTTSAGKCCGTSAGGSASVCLVHAMTVSKHRLAMRPGKMQRICPKEVCMQTDTVSDMSALLARSKAGPGFAEAGTRHTGINAKQPAQALQNTAEHNPQRLPTHACPALFPYAHAQNMDTVKLFCRHTPTFRSPYMARWPPLSK